jgi:alanyl-tRNA synthetase
VLRRVVRRASRHGHKLGCSEPFLHRLIPALVATMGDAYPELAEGQENLQQVLRKEEMKFHETLEKGVRILEEDLAQLEGSTIPGETIFLLYDTYGFPVDLTGDIARERGLALDLDGFEKAMEAQRSRARAASHFTMGTADAEALDVSTEFSGYDRLEDEGTVSRCSGMDAGSMPSNWARRASWCSTGPRFMPSPAGRWATSVADGLRHPLRSLRYP